MNLGKTVRTLRIDLPRPEAPNARPEIHAWRAWCVVRHPRWGGWMLRSTCVHFYWEGPAVWQGAPYTGVYGGNPLSNRTGFHFFKNPNHALRLAERARGVPGMAVSAVGRCAVHGKVIEHELGYRAQGAVLRSFQLLGPQDVALRIARRLEARYACEVAPASPSNRSSIFTMAQVSRSQ